MYDSERSYFAAQKVEHRAIGHLSIAVHEGEIVAVVGASGSGKSLLADAVMGLYEPNARVTGRIWFDGALQDAEGLARLRGSGLSLVPQSVASLDPLMKVGRQVQGVPAGRGAARREDARRGLARLRGSGLSLVPQSVASLDPLMKVGRQVQGVPAGRGAARREDARRRARKQEELFERYGLAPDVAELYPHELSGGMARRVLLCCALMDEPRVIIADEPTPGLDLDLAVRAMEDFRAFADEGGGVMLITHDIELALRVADRVAVFEAGTVVEETAVGNFASPALLRHPFSRALWHALPEHDFRVDEPAGGARAASSDDGAVMRDGASGA